MDAVRAAVRGDLSRFPLVAAGESAFARALRYPESMMICLDLKLCDQIEEQYRGIVRQGAVLHALLVAGRHEQAYLAWQDLRQRVGQLEQLLGALYLEARSNGIGRFLGFVQAALYLPGRKYLAVVNLQHLDHINKLYGNEVGNRALDRVEAMLREEFERHREWLLYTRGIAGDFYLLGLGVEADRFRGLLERLAARGRRDSGSELPVDAGFRLQGIEITRLGEISTEDLHLVIQYLTDRAHRDGAVLETSAEAVEAMLDWLRERYRQALDLRTRLIEEATDIFIQPLVTLDESREIHAFEVLGRFRGENGYLSAGLFIDDLIALGLAPLFDRLVLQAVIRHAPTLAKVTSRLFVNVSAASLAQPDYVQRLVDALHGPLEGFEVVMELTEQVLLEHRALVRDLHEEHGLTFAIDDFGTGYSTLQLVIELALEGTVSYLKLDGSLTRQLGITEASERIMQITRQMAKELNLVTVVEFIETLVQAERLEALQMDLGQGYLLGVPDPVPVWQGKLAYLRSKASLPGESGFTF
ncbi:MAG: EAL domain-containing protein [Gammaproteobacteria bacterium]|nr:MAG: EAL domain-containing protein [Gammaproteobacteria bacterium]